MPDSKLVSRVGRDYEWTLESLSRGTEPAMVEIPAPESDGSAKGRYVIVSQIKLRLGSNNGRLQLPNRHIVFQRTSPDGTDASNPTDQFLPTARTKSLILSDTFDPYERTSELRNLEGTGLRVFLDGSKAREIQWLYVSFSLMRV